MVIYQGAISLFHLEEGPLKGSASNIDPTTSRGFNATSHKTIPCVFFRIGSVGRASRCMVVDPIRSSQEKSTWHLVQHRHGHLRAPMVVLLRACVDFQTSCTSCYNLPFAKSMAALWVSHGSVCCEQRTILMHVLVYFRCFFRP